MAILSSSGRYAPPNAGTLNTLIQIQNVTRTQGSNGEYTEAWSNVISGSTGTIYCSWTYKTVDTDKQDDGRLSVISYAYVKIRKISGLTSTCRLRRTNTDGSSAEDWWYVVGEPEVYGQRGFIDMLVMRREKAM